MLFPSLLDNRTASFYSRVSSSLVMPRDALV